MNLLLLLLHHRFAPGVHIMNLPCFCCAILIVGKTNPDWRSGSLPSAHQDKVAAVSNGGKRPQR